MISDLLKYNIDYELVQGFDLEVLKKYNMVPLFKDELFVVVATSNINQAKDEFVELFDYPIKFVEVSFNQLQFEWQNIELKIKLFNLAMQALNDLNLNNNNSYILEFIDRLLDFCIDNNASDIHCECLDQSVIIRLRIDGELNQFFRFDIKLYQVISSIIKYLGNLDIAQKRLPLNARFSREVYGKSYDIRISTMPTIYGESIVLRILDNGNIQKNLDEIGFEQKTLTNIKDTIRLTQGLILVTGPTGSGKTTTLYSMLNELNNKSKKIITIEDPVEYKLDGVMQVNINNEIDLSYHIVLKNILRQDPDILMIGEIRDSESLQTALQASLTGHLVIATLHTNNAVETITRLLDLQAKPYLIASSLKMVLSQRLLRKLCNECKSLDEKTGEYEAKGCISCNFTGYKDRQVVSEILKIDRKISDMIANEQNISEILDQMQDKGFNTLSSNGKKLVKNGVTTRSEFYSKL